MIETRTSWEDSGYDCDHCGGQIFRRTDYETGQSPRVCYQCRACGCQWTMDGETLRIGRKAVCKVAHRRQARSVPDSSMNIPSWVWGILVVVFLLAAVRFGGLAALRFLVPLVLAALAIRYTYRLGQERQWW